VLLVISAISCAVSRDGWGGGKFVVVKELAHLQVRRSPIRVDPRTNGLVLSWIGVRAVEGAPDILECSFTVFDDRNGDRIPQADEIVRQRSNSERARKVMFDELRFADAHGARPSSALLVVRTERERREIRFPLKAD
jgi:hypothetical protein